MYLGRHLIHMGRLCAHYWGAFHDELPASQPADHLAALAANDDQDDTMASLHNLCLWFSSVGRPAVCSLWARISWPTD